ncbi:hypothetical protein XENOCAPTIV_012417, partial [Xenoophorus captivus]
ADTVTPTAKTTICCTFPGQSNTAPPVLDPAADTIARPEEPQARTSGISGTHFTSSTSRTPRKSAEPPLCTACGKSTSEAGHFAHRTKVFCKSTSGEVSLLDWVKINVPRVTRWRWMVQQEVMVAGVPALSRKKSICTKCHRRLTREMGHSRYKGHFFCEATDPSGLTVGQGLKEPRGGGLTPRDVHQKRLEKMRAYNRRPEVRERSNKWERENWRKEEKEESFFRKD